MSKPNNKVKRTTPRGTFSWPRLNTPDTKFDAAGKYSCKLVLDGSDPVVQAFVAEMEKARDDFLAATVETLKSEKKAALAMELKAGEVIKIDRDQETGEETGKLIFMASMKASGTRKDGSAWTQKPDIFDAKGKKLDRPPVISGGTEGKLSVEIEPFINQTSKQAVLSIRLKAAQILRLASGGARTFSDHGFEAEEGDELDDVQAFADETDGGDTDGGQAAHDDL